MLEQYLHISDHQFGLKKQHSTDMCIFTVKSVFAIYVDDLSQDLAMCKSGCYINEQCIKHVMYADDICLPASIAIGLQRMLDVCFDFSIRNDIKFNPIKFVCIVFKPKNNNLYCPNVRVDRNILEYISCTKYLDFTFNINSQDDDDMLRQMRTLYIRFNKLLRTFHYCSIDVKLELFRSFYMSFTVAIYGLHTINQRLISYVLLLITLTLNNGKNFEAVFRKSTYGFILRLHKSTNSLIMAIEKS